MQAILRLYVYIGGSIFLFSVEVLIHHGNLTDLCSGMLISACRLLI